MSFVERCRRRHLGSEGGDEGFTLIELLVVLLIIGILLAIAIPTFLSVTKGANNTAAQSNLQNALTGAKTYFTDTNQSYIGLDGCGNTNCAGTSDISQIGTGLQWVSKATASNGPHVISVDVVSASAVVLAAWSNGTNDCWVIVDNTTQGAPTTTLTAAANPGTYFGVLTGGASGGCTATAVSGSAAVNTSLVTTGFPSA